MSLYFFCICGTWTTPELHFYTFVHRLYVQHYIYCVDIHHLEYAQCVGLLLRNDLLRGCHYPRFLTVVSRYVSLTFLCYTANKYDVLLPVQNHEWIEYECCLTWDCQILARSLSKRELGSQWERAMPSRVAKQSNPTGIPPSYSQLRVKQTFARNTSSSVAAFARTQPIF